MSADAGVGATRSGCAHDSPLAQAAAGLDACVHCGFCLPACPTYVNLHDENDSPRGRLLLMQRLLDGVLPLDDPDVGTHLDRCLGCRACETACPSGVPYGELLEATRATMRAVRPVPPVARLVLAVFRRPWLLRPALLAARLFRATRLPRWLARVLPVRLRFPMAMLAASSPVRLSLTGAPARVKHAGGTGGATITSRGGRATASPVVMLTGCVMRGLFAHTNAATERVVTACGHHVQRAPDQGCCGALHAHAGDLDAARALARLNIAAFEHVPDARVVVNSAGCGAMLKDYGHLLRDDPEWHARAASLAARVCDISELVAPALSVDAENAVAASNDTNARNENAPDLPLRVAYDPPCHLMHAQRITRQPLTLLDAIPGVERVPLEDADQCCGSAGIYNLVEPETSDAVLAPKLRRIAEARVQLVASGNPGCLMQIGAGLLLGGHTARAVHPIDLLDASLRAHG